jgi:hypothetical protein
MTATTGTEFLAELVAAQETNITAGIRVLLEIKRLGDFDRLRVIKTTIDTSHIARSPGLVTHGADAQHVANLAGRAQIG